MDTTELLNEALGAVNTAATLRALDEVRVQYLGQKGVITSLLKELGGIADLQEKRARGTALHGVRTALLESLDAKKAQLEDAAIAAQLAADAVDVTLPGDASYNGRIHPLTAAMEEVAGCLKRLGFVHAWGPEIVTDEENFTELNLPAHHPARQDQDSFF